MPKLKNTTVLLTAILLATTATADLQFKDPDDVKFHTGIQMNQNQIQGLSDSPASSSSALSNSYIQNNYLASSGDAMNGNLDMNGSSIQKVDQINGQEASQLGAQNLTQVLGQGRKANTTIRMQGYRILNIGDPLNPTDALNLGTANTNFVNRSGDSINGSIDMLDHEIRNLKDPDNPQDAATRSFVENYADSNDANGTDDQTLSVNNDANGRDDEITIENGNTITVSDYFEADTNAETICGTGEVLTGNGCTSRYTASDDSDSALGNEGVNDVSFDTSTGELTLQREHRTALTQNLDGRYTTTDNYIGDTTGHTAGGNLDMDGNTVGNLSAPVNSNDAVRLQDISGEYLDKDGDTMNGDLNLGNHNLDGVSGIYNDDSTTNFFGGCPSGQYVESINADGSVTCVSDTTADEYGSWSFYTDGSSRKSVSSGQAIGIDSGTAISLNWDGSRDVSVSVNEGSINHNNLVNSGDSDAHHTRYSNEESQDAVGGIITGSGATSVNYDDSGNTITVSSTDNYIGDSSSHTAGGNLNMGSNQLDTSNGELVVPTGDVY